MKKNLLENSLVGNMAVPIAIVLLGALIVFGVSKMLSTDRSHRDLIAEMSSKTFGNRWVAAYELSKLIARSSIPEEELPWTIAKLAELMREAKGPRARKFIVAALGAMKDVRALPIIGEALEDSDPQVRFNAVIALSQMPPPIEFDWQLLENFLRSSDTGLIQVVLLTYATHRVEEGRKHLLSFLENKDASLRFSAATGLINYREKKALPVLREILSLDSFGEGNRVESLKLNVLLSIARNEWRALNPDLVEFLKREKNLKIIGKAKEILNKLKN